MSTIPVERMPKAVKASVSPITNDDVPGVAAFLHENLSTRVSAAAWVRALDVPWSVDAPNHGFLLRANHDIVGAYVAYYSQREVGGRVLDVCNLGAWCVLEEHRFSGLRLLKALLAQPGYHFTDLSPSGNVIALNERLGFTSLDVTTAMSLNLPWPPWRGRARVTSDPDVIESTVNGRDRQIYLDHRETAAARHAVVIADEAWAYVLFRHDRRKSLPWFVSILYVSDPDVLRDHFRQFSRFVLLRHRAIATLSELRVVCHRPPLSVVIPKPRPKMFKSTVLTPGSIDYLYSEMECLEW